MDELIMKLTDVKDAIQTLERFAPTAHNCNLILACIQILDYVIDKMQKEDGAE